MKSLRFLLLLLTVGLFSQLQAQTLKDVFNNADAGLFYYGIDFSKVKIIDDANANANDIIDRQFDGVNDLVVNEPKKYDIKGAFNKNNVDHDLSYVSKKNEKADAKQLLSTTTTDFQRFTEKDIEAAVKGLTVGSQSGVGLLFVAEAISKSKKSMAVWVTLFDIKTKKVLMTDRIEGKLGMAFSFRNYLGTGIADIIKTIEKKKFKEWKAKYGG